MEAEAQREEDYSEPRKQHAGKDALMREWGIFMDCGGELLGEAWRSDQLRSAFGRMTTWQGSESMKNETSDKKHAVILTKSKVPLQIATAT